MPKQRHPTSAKIAKLLCLSLMLTMSCSGTTLDQPKTIIEKAVSALGGKKELDKLKAIHARFEATAFLGDHGAPCVLESWYRYPTRLKTDLRCNVNGRQYILIQVVKGDQGWRSENGETHQATGHNLTELTDLTGKQLLRETVYSDYRKDKQWMRMAVFQDGKKVLEMKLIEVKFLDNIPDSVFVRP